LKRHCGSCSLDLPLTEKFFHRSASRASGWSYPCKQCRNKYNSQHRKDKPEKYEAERARTKERFRKLRVEVLNKYSGGSPQCACCKDTNMEFLVIDHVNGGGNLEREVVGWGGRFYHWLKKQGYPTGYRVLCANCNSALGAYGRCPHQLGT